MTDRVPRPGIPETAFQRSLIHLAHLRRWRVAHFRKAQNSRGQWRTPVAGDGAGFPDLVLIRTAPDHRLIFAELKTDRGTTTADQRRWLADLGMVAHRSGHQSVEVYVWRPRDWESIQEILR